MGRINFVAVTSVAFGTVTVFIKISHEELTVVNHKNFVFYCASFFYLRCVEFFAEI